MKIIKNELIYPLIVCLLFFLFYTVLSLVRHNHFLSGYDLAVIDQAIWKYSRFKNPISTNHAYAYTPVYWDHVELIFLLIAPFYWIFDSVKTLIILQVLAITLSGIPVYLLAKKKGLNTFLCYTILICYFLFYGLQNAVWSDVHSIVFGVSFLAWFLYFLETENYSLATPFFILAIISKEDVALLTLFISGILFLSTRKKRLLIFALFSIVYLFAIFFIYFPHFVPGGYRFQSKNGLLSNINISNFYNTSEKKQVLLYSIASFGFLPFLSPLALLAALGDLSHYFILGNNVVSSAQGLFGHYRVSLALLLIWPTILAISKIKRLNNIYIGAYLLACTLFFQYYLHSPISYLTKTWFWTKPHSVESIKSILNDFPQQESLVTQVNIQPHVSHRDLVFLMWPEEKKFTKNSPCGKLTCHWFRWPGKPHYMIIDTSNDWDSRYWLTNHDEFADGVKNLEHAGVIIKIKRRNTTTLYKVLKNPDSLKI